jgi:hypothetical protein
MGRKQTFGWNVGDARKADIPALDTAQSLHQTAVLAPLMGD